MPTDDEKTKTEMLRRIRLWMKELVSVYNYNCGVSICVFVLCVCVRACVCTYVCARECACCIHMHGSVVSMLHSHAWQCSVHVAFTCMAV